MEDTLWFGKAGNATLSLTKPKCFSIARSLGPMEPNQSFLTIGIPYYCIVVLKIILQIF